MKKKQSVPASGYREIQIKSAAPIWGAALVWGLAALTMPMHKLSVILLTSIVSLAVYGFITLVLPKKTVKEKIPFTSGDQTLDAIVHTIDDASEKISAAAKSTFAEKPAVSDRMNEILSSILKIRTEITRFPKKIKKISRFLSYYLPTTVKICDKYVYLLGQRTKGENVTEALASIEKALEQIRNAFDKQHDALFEEDALDMTTDVAVLETLLKQDALDQ